MSNGKRHIGLFGASGILVAALIITAFVAMGSIFQAQGKGTLTIQIMDKPVTLTTLNMTIDWVRIQTQEGWINLTVTTAPQPLYFDLLRLAESTLTLTKDEIPDGNYSVIQMHVLTANATWNSDSGEVYKELDVPSNWIKVYLNPSLEIETGEEVTVLIDLQPDQNSISISHSLNIRPVIKAVVG